MDSGDDEWNEELPEPTVDAAERLTRLAREAVDEAEAEAYREDRAERLADHGFTARVREDDDTLVCYPDEWIEDGTVQIDRIDNTDRAVEVSLSGPGDPDDWSEVEEHNAALVEQVAEEHTEVHAANARAFADFMGNHYARPMDSADADEVQEFLDEYFPRNAWPSEEQRDAVRASLRHVFEAADERTPL
ncbi:rnhA operon protein [Halobaculum rubrum]|nr:rnhA operon protein [Halobaculum rubrum]